MMSTVRTKTLEIAYEEHGPSSGPPVVLLHGFPYAVQAYESVAPALAEAGCRVLVPHLRGHGPTRFLHADTPRSGEQAALGADLLDLIDALGLIRPVLAGYDWGGRAACVVSALWPERVGGLVSITGYNIQDIAGAAKPGPAAQEWRWWYQYYFHTERGVAGLQENRREIAQLLWRMWSPDWRFTPAQFEASAAAWDNPDWVDVVVQSYRHRFGNAPGDPALLEIESALAKQPDITVPTIVLHGAADGVSPVESSAKLDRFPHLVRREVVPLAGHNLPQEVPEPVVRAVLELVPRGA